MVGMKSDYCIVTFQTNSDPQSWHWEFRRSRNPMGVKVRGRLSNANGGRACGKRELANFLELLAKEERRQG
jgi:hypothetical protein